MLDQTDSHQITEPSQTAPSVRERRVDALQRALRARQILDHADALAVRDRASEGAGDDRPDEGRALDDGPNAAGVDGTLPELERLREIHQSLQHERHAARLPFHRHSDRLVLALELAERLALDRLGFDDFADFENRAQIRHDSDVVDLDLVERAQRDLADAEATLAELDGLEGVEGVELRLPTWTVDPVLRDTARRRATRMRRQVFGAADALDRDGPGAPVDAATTEAQPAPLPFRRPRPDVDRVEVSPSAPSDQRERDRTQDREQDRVLGEIVRNGRIVRVEKVGGLVYLEDEDDPGAGAISYGDPNRTD